MALLLHLAIGAQILYLRHRMKFTSFLLLHFCGAVLVITAAAQACQDATGFHLQHPKLVE
ncbi:MAG: hypothetical protein ABSG04_03890 [Verrucomicrobiota bacterium]